MNKKISRILGIALPLLLGVFLVIYNYSQFTPGQLDDMMNSFRTANYLYVYISLIIGLTGFWARAYRWKYTLAHIGYTAPFGIKFGAVCITYIMNMAIPRSGEVSRAVALNKYAGIPFDKAFGTIIAERIIDMALLVIVVAVTVFFQFDVARDYIADIPFKQIIFYGIIAAILFAGSVLFFIYSKMEWVQKIRLRISGLTEGVLSVFKMPNKWPFLLLSLYIWFSYVLMFYITIYALPETSGLSFGSVATAFVIGSIVITFTNGGTGWFPVAIANILTIYHVPESAGAAFGWIVWTSQTAQILFLGGLSFLLLPLLYRNK
ncbi:lysylphosphatidylglycerol synthase transmembrane domain-containing protein [uncultured Flavobacterium sp.]|uniref:lysylphosphatidylglycerol synthase transmembrane domain-containing protein n=1 Tax=uncultured Flavobacterium sp. TaxID=165435 RepID=UPI0025FACFAE|nr:lysylphosphatidylglycerol synthase transmembrane domain-containing protein [uncultured Flavobacterium sp.]